MQPLNESQPSPPQDPGMQAAAPDAQAAAHESHATGPPAYVPERRPIASRDHSWSIGAAEFLAKRRISPNAISLAGMISGVMAGGLLAATSWGAGTTWLFLGSAIAMQLRLVANMLDGMVALRSDRASRLGELFNEVPDRVSDTAICVGAGYALGSRPELGYWACILSLFTAYVRAEGKVAGAPQEFCGPMAKPQRMAVLTVAAVYAGLAPAGWPAAAVVGGGRSALDWGLWIVAVGAGFTIVRRLWRVGRVLVQRPPASRAGLEVTP